MCSKRQCTPSSPSQRRQRQRQQLFPNSACWVCLVLKMSLTCLFLSAVRGVRVVSTTFPTNASTTTTTTAKKTTTKTTTTTAMNMKKKLLSRSHPQRQRQRQRQLEDGNDDDMFAYDLSKYGVRFGKCQHVKMFDDEIAQDMESDTVFAMKHFVLYRMCPIDNCQKCDQQYGEYVVEVDQYLKNMAEYYAEDFERKCQVCDENNNADDAGDGDDDGDGDDAAAMDDANNNNNNNNNNDEDDLVGFCNECEKYNNLEDYGYVDASEYIECQKVNVEFDDDGENDDDNNNENVEVYLGPRCTNDGARIVIDVFSDENCWEIHEDYDVESLLGVKLSYHLLKSSYSSSGTNADCVACAESDQQDNIDDAAADNQDADDVFEMCENIYAVSAKCETIHGFRGGFMDMDYNDDYNRRYENQVQNEQEVCTFINSLAWGSYDETGEINVGQPQDYIIRYNTPLQKMTLATIAATIFTLVSYAIYLYREIEATVPLELSSQGGTLT